MPPRSRSRRRVLHASGLLCIVLLAGACGGARFSAPEPVTRQGQEILRLWQGSVVAAAGVAALVWALIAFAVVRYRRRDDEVPGQGADNLPLEVVYTGVPLLIVVGLFAFTVATQRDVTETVDHPDLEVEVVGFQWQWQFRYPGEGVTVDGAPGRPARMVLPVGRTVRLKLVASDVIHSFWVPRFLSKRDLIPGIDNEIDVDVEEAGRWVGRCAEFCGLDHYKMNFSVEAVPEAEFRAWVAGQKGAVPPGAGAAAPAPPAAVGP